MKGIVVVSYTGVHLYKAFFLSIISNFYRNSNFYYQIFTGQLVERECVRLWSGRFEVQILGPVKSETVLPTARHRCDISSKGAVLPARNDASMGPVNLLNASAYYSEYNERFDLFLIFF